jgi:hypothetical protein
MGLVLDILNDIRSRIAASEEVLKEAQDRRDLAAEGGMELDGALRWFRSGSVAHGTVNKPVTDADSGLVLDRRNERYAKLGPDGEGEGPDDVCDEVAELVGEKVRTEYPEATVKHTRRGICVEYNEPLNADEDPTVDLIVTLTRKDAEGLWILTATTTAGLPRIPRSTPSSSPATQRSCGPCVLALPGWLRLGTSSSTRVIARFRRSTS